MAVDTYLASKPDDEARNVDNLLANANVPLLDEHTGMVHALGQAELEHLGLQPPLKEILDLETKHVIELGLGLVEHTDPDKPADERVTLEQTLGVLFLEREQLTGSTTDVGEEEADAPDFALVLEAILADELHLLVQTLGLERPAGHLGDLGVCERSAQPRSFANKYPAAFGPVCPASSIRSIRERQIQSASSPSATPAHKGRPSALFAMSTPLCVSQLGVGIFPTPPGPGQLWD